MKTLIVFLLLNQTLFIKAQVPPSFGCIKNDGTWLIKPEFESFNTYENGYAAVKKDGAWGIIDTNGSFVINPIFEEVQIGSDCFLIKDKSKYGFLNFDGTTLIEPQYYNASCFYYGYSIVKNIHGEYGIVNRNDLVTKEIPNCSFLFQIGPDRFWKINTDSGLVGIIDANNHWIYSTSISQFTILSDTLAVSDNHNKLAYITCNGIFLTEYIFDEALSFQNGYARVQVGSKWGVIKSDGSWQIQPAFDELTNYSEGLFGAKQGKLWGFININAQWVIQPSYSDVYIFREGFAAVRSGKKWGFINSDGTWLLIDMNSKFEKTPFDEVNNFNESLAVVSIKNKYGVIKADGTWLVKPTFFSANSWFSNGRLIIR